MHAIIHDIINILEHHTLLLYCIIFLGMIFEGEAIVFATIFLINEGFIDSVHGFVFLVAGLLIGDTLWYIAGYWWLGKFKWLAKISDKVTKTFDRQLRHKPFRIILLSKFTYGIHHAILLRAGRLKLNFNKYFKIIFLANIIWFCIVGSLAYLFSVSIVALRFKKYIKYAEVGILVIVLGIFFVERAVGSISESLLSSDKDKGE